MKKYTDVKPDVKKLKVGDEILKNIYGSSIERVPHFTGNA